MQPTQSHLYMHPLIQKFFIVASLLSLVSNTASIFIARQIYQAPTGLSFIDIALVSWPLLLLLATFLLRPVRPSKLAYTFEVVVLTMATVIFLNFVEYTMMMLSSTNTIKLPLDFWPITLGCAAVLYIAALAFVRFRKKPSQVVSTPPKGADDSSKTAA